MKKLLFLSKISSVIFTFFKNFLVNKSLNFSITLLMSMSLLSVASSITKAQTAENLPKELIEAIAEIEKAANKQNLAELLEYYDEDFTNTDGLTYASLSEALRQMWRNYPQMRYSTKIESWEEEGDQLIANTVTYIRGTQRNRGRVARLNSTLRSRQYFQERKLVRQEIISEQTKLTSGIKPPRVTVIVPEQVGVGEKYNFDVIATEPLENDLLLGAAIEDKISSDRYINPSTLELKPLPAGGIYKIVTAPRLADSQWLSAILVRGDGITMVTRRVNIGRK